MYERRALAGCTRCIGVAEAQRGEHCWQQPEPRPRTQPESGMRRSCARVARNACSGSAASLLTEAALCPGPGC